MMYVKVVLSFIDDREPDWLMEARDLNWRALTPAEIIGEYRDGVGVIGKNADCEPKKTVHAILLRLWENMSSHPEGYREVMVIGPATVFIMSDSGKTIDRLAV